LEPAPTKSARHPLTNQADYQAGLSRAERQTLQHLFEKALEWLQHSPPNYQQTLAGLAQCMKSDPQAAVYCYEYLQTIEVAITANHLRFNWFARRKNRKLVQEIKQLVGAENWQAVFERAPKAIYHNPRHAQLLTLLAAACQTTDAPDCARAYCQFALKYDPSCQATHRQIIINYLTTGQFDDAKEHWLQLHMRNTFTLSQLQQLEQALPVEIQATLPSLELAAKVDQLDTQLSQDPQDEKTWHQLCKLYQDNQLFSRALECCQLANQALGKSAGWEQLSLQLRKQQAEDRISFYKRDSPTTTNFASPWLMGELTDELARVRTEYYQSRCTTFPNEQDNFVRLAWCLSEADNSYEALKVFNNIDLSQLSPPWSVIALLGQGETEQRLRQFDKAVESFKNALNIFEQSLAGTQQSGPEFVDIPTLQHEQIGRRLLKRSKLLAQAMDLPLITQQCATIAKKTSLSIDI
jgi:tetratricopeptide (TPR) repeat protein